MVLPGLQLSGVLCAKGAVHEGYVEPAALDIKEHCAVAGRARVRHQVVTAALRRIFSTDASRPTNHSTSLLKMLA